MKLRLMNPWDSGDPINKIFNDFSRGWTLISDDDKSLASLAVNLSEDENNYYAEVEVPGIKSEDIEIDVEDRYVTVKGKSKIEEENKNKKYHLKEIFETEFLRTFTLPGPVNVDEIKAISENGILKITLPKSQKSVSKKIKVE